jgi:hypothetical protein
MPLQSFSRSLPHHSFMPFRNPTPSSSPLLLLVFLMPLPFLLRFSLLPLAHLLSPHLACLTTPLSLVSRFPLSLPPSFPRVPRSRTLALPSRPQLPLFPHGSLPPLARLPPSQPPPRSSSTSTPQASLSLFGLLSLALTASSGLRVVTTSSLSSLKLLAPSVPSTSPCLPRPTSTLSPRRSGPLLPSFYPAPSALSPQVSTVASAEQRVVTVSPHPVPPLPTLLPCPQST